jgi:putative flippase GtrA
LSWLRSLDRELLAQGGRFVLAGGFITVLYLAVVTVMRTVLDAPWAVAIAVGYVIAPSTHFVLHRRLVFRNERGFELSVAQQLPRFVAVVACQYAFTAAAMAVLPSVLGLPSLLVFFGVAAAVTAVSFVVLRTRLFH